MNPITKSNNRDNKKGVLNMTTTMTKKDLTKNFAAANIGDNYDVFNTAALNRSVKGLYEAKARGELSLWDMARILTEVKADIASGKYEATDPEITSFRAYCEKIGIDYSNHAKYVRAYEEYADLRFAGFSLGVAVAFLGSGESAEDIAANFTPIELTVKAAKEFTKSRKNAETVPELIETTAEPDEAPAEPEIMTTDPVEDIPTEPTITLNAQDVKNLMNRIIDIYEERRGNGYDEMLTRAYIARELDKMFAED
jgi:hypothetical protein